MSTTKRKTRRKRDRLVLKLLVMIALVLIIFEGNLVRIMFTYRSGMNAVEVNGTDTSEHKTTEGTLSHSEAASPVTVKVKDSNSREATLAGLGITTSKAPVSQANTASSSQATTTAPGSSAIVPLAATPVDDSYFSDAAFIGDSRMEGFRMASGITQGQFFTSIGMSLQSMRSENVIKTSQGNITVAAALSGQKYNKIYIMLGTNDLGEFDWDSFRDGFTSVLQRFEEIQPDAIIYICSVIYVEESKISDTRYINNTNVDKINSILLGICEKQGYHYLDLNEFLSNGYHSLLEGASSDGVHMYETYCKQMLTYLKNHYIPVAPKEEKPEETETETEMIEE